MWWRESYFFTVTLADRSSRLLVDRIDDLREAFRTVRVQRPFALDAVVILPDHLHCIWTLSPGDADYALRWCDIKSRVSDWPYSSFHRKVREGIYWPEWAGGDDVEAHFGE